MRTLLISVLLAVSAMGTEAMAQSTSREREPRINLDVPVNDRARIRFDLREHSQSEDTKYRLSSRLPAYRYQDPCVVPNEWTMVTPFHDCSRRSLRRGRPMLRFIYVF